MADLDLAKDVLTLDENRKCPIKYTEKGIQISVPTDEGSTTITFSPYRVEGTNIVCFVENGRIIERPDINPIDLGMLIQKYGKKTGQPIPVIAREIFFGVRKLQDQVTNLENTLKQVPVSPASNYEARISALEKALGEVRSGNDTETRLTNLELEIGTIEQSLAELIERQEKQEYAPPQAAAPQASETQTPQGPETPIPQPQQPITNSYKMYENPQNPNAVLERIIPDNQRTIYLFTPDGVLDKDRKPIENPEPDILEKYAYWRDAKAAKSEAK